MAKVNGTTTRSVYVATEYEGEWAEVKERMARGERMSTIVGEALRSYFKKGRAKARA